MERYWHQVRGPSCFVSTWQKSRKEEGREVERGSQTYRQTDRTQSFKIHSSNNAEFSWPNALLGVPLPNIVRLLKWQLDLNTSFWGDTHSNYRNIFSGIWNWIYLYMNIYNHGLFLIKSDILQMLFCNWILYLICFGDYFASLLYILCSLLKMQDNIYIQFLI